MKSDKFLQCRETQIWATSDPGVSRPGSRVCAAFCSLIWEYLCSCGEVGGRLTAETCRQEVNMIETGFYQLI